MFVYHVSEYFWSSILIFLLGVVIAVVFTLIWADSDGKEGGIVALICGLIAVGLVVSWGVWDIGRVKESPHYQMAVLEEEISKLEKEKEQLEDLNSRLSALEASEIDYSTISLEELRERVSALSENKGGDQLEEP